MGPTDSRPNLKVDVVFPVLHGTFGEDGTVQGLLELAGLPYVGRACWLPRWAWIKTFRSGFSSMRKFRSCLTWRFARTQWEQDRKETLAAIQKKLRYPMFVKPATLGSSVGMTRVAKAAELPAAIDMAAEFALKILVEKAVSAREIEVSVLGNENPEASMPGEIVPHREFYDYTAKYLEGGSRIEIPAKLTKAQVKKIREYAVQAYQSIDCTGMARADFFLEKKSGRIFVNELNTIPGFTSISMYPKMWEASGLPLHKIDRQADPTGAGFSRAKSPDKILHRITGGAGGALEAYAAEESTAKTHGQIGPVVNPGPYDGNSPLAGIRDYGGLIHFEIEGNRNRREKMKEALGRLTSASFKAST